MLDVVSELHHFLCNHSIFISHTENPAKLIQQFWAFYLNKFSAVSDAMCISSLISISIYMATNRLLIWLGRNLYTHPTHTYAMCKGKGNGKKWAHTIIVICYNDSRVYQCICILMCVREIASAVCVAVFDANACCRWCLCFRNFWKFHQMVLSLTKRNQLNKRL